MSIEDVGILLAGLLWPILYHFIRTRIAPDLQGQVAHAVAVLVCFAIAGALEATTAGTVTLSGLLAHGSEITALAWVVYRQGIKPATDTPAS